jgi:enamine deaminase RidA (YjgF/YER057c/UK114 family)
MMKHIRPAKRLSGATVHNGIVYLSGQVPDNLDGTIKDQAREVIEKIDGILKEANSDKSKILSAMVWLPDIGDRDAFNTVWDAWAPEPGPARACVESKLANPRIKIEISVVAIAGS